MIHRTLRLGLLMFCGCVAGQAAPGASSPPIATGRSTIAVVCELTTRCDNMWSPKAHCYTHRTRCRVVERTSGKSSWLRWDGITDQTRFEADFIEPLVFDRTHGVFWFVADGWVRGVATEASQLPGSMATAPALIADASKFQFETKTNGAGIVVFRSTATFRLWHPDTERALEVALENPDDGGHAPSDYAVGDRKVAYCTIVGDVAHWSTIDINASFTAGAGQIETGTASAKTYAHAGECAKWHLLDTARAVDAEL